MSNSDTSIFNQEQPKQLASVLAAITDEKSMQKFLRDVMTEGEISEISARLEAAKLLTDGKTYDEIIERTKLSSRTVARISDWLKNGAGGYQKAIELTSKSHTHI